MKENVFTVDLGNLPLSDDIRKEINASIQRAVTGVIAKSGLDNKIVLFPIHHLPKGPIWNGIIARPIHDVGINNIEQLFAGQP